jgi:glycosyltransferase involved in cell wall biosynthesis
MNRLRVALVTRRFWPLMGGAESLVANLAAELKSRGADPLVVTAQWDRSWPCRLALREVPVVRLPQPTPRAWGTLRYMLALGRWLRRHRQQLDAVYVSMLKHDAYVALRSLRGTDLPVVLRVEGGGPTGDCHWQQTAAFGARIKRRCLTADAIVAPSQPLAEELLTAGYAPERVVRINNGVHLGEFRDPAVRRAARIMLTDLNWELNTSEGTPVAVFVGRLHMGKGLEFLVRAWRIVVRRWRHARLWLVGAGPDRGRLVDLVHDLELRGKVILPGPFSDAQSTLLAADVFVLPSQEEGMSISLLEAMAARLPVVASDIPGNRPLVEHEKHGLLVPYGDPEALAGAISRLFENRRWAYRLAAAARQQVEQEFSIGRVAEEHLELFSRLISMKSPSSS